MARMTISAWRARPFFIGSSRTGPRRLRGECGTLKNSPTNAILAILGPGEVLTRPVREAVEAVFGSDFSRVRVHTDFSAQVISEALGAEAFTIANHIAFRRGRFQPNYYLGQELLHHELAHVLEADGREDRIHGWFSARNDWNRPEEKRTYRLWGKHKQLLIAGRGATVVKTHEAITKEALDYIGGYGEGARRVIDYWVAEIDRWKADRTRTLGDLASRRSSGRAQPDFPELNALIRDAGGVGEAVNLLHAFGGQNSPPGEEAIGMTSLEVTSARLTGRGVIGKFLDQAVSSFNNGFHDHALRLLGISLHTIQDFYSHKVPLRDQNLRDLRIQGLTEGGSLNVSILEDDSDLDQRRWLMARHRTAEQLRGFIERLTPEKKGTLSSM